MRNPENADGQGTERPKTRICEVCGQEIDLTDPDEIFHHGPEPHEPIAR
jgi:hypothetical protein